MLSTTRSRTRLFVGALLFALLLVLPVRPADAVTPQPTQWIAKQYTELLGRSPTAAEWKDWIQYYASPTTDCSASTLATLGKQLALSPEFAADYPETTALDKAMRVTALIRATFKHDPNTNDWNNFFVPYNNGTETWEDVVNDIYARQAFIAWNVPPICSTTEASYGFAYTAPLDIRVLTSTGVSRTEQQLQSDIDAVSAAGGGTVYLEPGEVVRIGGTANANAQLVIKPGVTLSTRGLPLPTKYARMGRLVPSGPNALVCGGTLCNGIGIVNVQSGASLTNVWVDGQGTDASNYKLANVETQGSTPTAPTHVNRNRISSPGRDGVGIRARGFSVKGTDCTDEEILGNLVTGYPSQHRFDGLAQAQWADGIAVFCEATVVQNNKIVDVSDAGIVLYGSYNRALADGMTQMTQRSEVSGNVVISAGLDAHVALGADAMGECVGHLSGRAVPCLDIPTERSFEGAALHNNTFWTGPRTSFDVALLIGGGPLWGDHRVYGRGVAFQSNGTAGVGARANIGISVLGMHGVTLTGNTATYTLIDGNPQSTWEKCPLANVAVGSVEDAELQPGSQSHTVSDAADGCLVGEPPPPPGGLERIAVSVDGTGLVGVEPMSERKFVPWGMRTPGTTLIEDFWNQDWPRVVEAFREIRRMGANIVRIKLQFRKYVDPPTTGYPNGTPNQAALSKLADLVSLAEQTGLYVDLSGLRIEADADLTSDPPGGDKLYGDPPQRDWYDALDEAGRWAAQKVFWSSVALTVKNSNAVAWYDLMNEPVSPATSKDRWCAGSPLFGSCFAQYLTKTPGSRTQLQIAQQWMTQMNNAIRGTAGDTQHLISVGLFAQSGFRSSDVTDLENFGSFHMYPRPDGSGLQDDITTVKMRKPPGQPLVVDEVFTTKADEADVQTFILGTRPEASGWLGHYFEQTPSELTPNPDDNEAKQLGFYKMFVPMTIRLNPSGTGTLQP